ncbi:50S ribosomal protein L3, partial [Pseudomonas syringae]
MSPRQDTHTDDYRDAQHTVGERHASSGTAAQAGHSAKANVAAGRTVMEFRLAEGAHQAGDKLPAAIFAPVQLVVLTCLSLGQGFPGPTTRWLSRDQDQPSGHPDTPRPPVLAVLFH